MATDTLPPPPPRRLKLKPVAAIGLAFIAMFLIGALVVTPLAMLPQIMRARTLLSSGKTIEAKILSRHLGKERMNPFHLVIQFTDMGKTITSDRLVSMQVDNRYANSSTVPVIVMPTDPTDFEVGSVDTDSIYEPFFFAGMFALVGVILLVVLGRRMSDERQLLKNGEAAMAEIKFVDQKNLGNGPVTSLSYRFPTPDGPRSGDCKLPGSYTDLYRVGQSVAVIYDPDDKTYSVATSMTQFFDLA